MSIFRKPETTESFTILKMVSALAVPPPPLLSPISSPDLQLEISDSEVRDLESALGTPPQQQPMEEEVDWLAVEQRLKAEFPGQTECELEISIDKEMERLGNVFMTLQLREMMKNPHLKTKEERDRTTEELRDIISGLTLKSEQDEEIRKRRREEAEARKKYAARKDEEFRKKWDRNEECLYWGLKYQSWYGSEEEEDKKDEKQKHSEDKKQKQKEEIKKQEGGVKKRVRQCKKCGCRHLGPCIGLTKSQKKMLLPLIPPPA
jgi:hypothetical protein